MTTTHSSLPDAGQLPHPFIDQQLPSAKEKALLRILGDNAPEEITGARDDPEAALANLIAALETLGLITGSTTAS